MVRASACITSFIIFLLLAFSNACAEESGYKSVLKNINVLASGSMTNVITELVQIYSKENDVTVSATFEAPKVLTKTIEEGEPADVYIAEDTILLQKLKHQGMVDVFTISNIAQTQLAILAPEDYHIDKDLENMSAEEIIELLVKRSFIVISDPENTMAGDYARDLLVELGIWEKVSQYIIKSSNNRSALYLVAKGKNAGILYESDAYNNSEVKIIKLLESNNFSAINYQAAVVAGENMQIARDFLEFLKSKEAKKIFVKHGFIVS